MVSPSPPFSNSCTSTQKNMLNPLRNPSPARRLNKLRPLKFRSFRPLFPILVGHRFKILIFFFLLWSCLTCESQFFWWLHWALVGEPQPVDPNLIQNCTPVNLALPVAVVVPLISSQTDRLLWSMKRWSEAQYSPCGNGSLDLDVALIFYFDRDLEFLADSVKRLKGFVEGEVAEAVERCFKGGVEFKGAGLSEQESRNSYGMDLVRNLVKTKGSNAQFERIFGLLDKYRHFFYMEPDVMVIRSRWLERVVEEMGWGDFWMRGSVMRYVPRFNIGWEPWRSLYQRHLNGNAIYRVGDNCFGAYRKLVRRVYGDGAFDVAMMYYRGSLKRISTFQSVEGRFGVSEVIVDLGVTRFSEQKVLEKFPRTYLVHGKFMHLQRPWLNFMQYR